MSEPGNWIKQFGAFSLLGLCLLPWLVQASPTSDVTFCSSFETIDCHIGADDLPPTFLEQEPASGFVLPGENPELGVLVQDALSGLDTASVRFYLDGVDVTGQVTWDESVLRYRPAAPPSQGRHQWKIEARDRANNQSSFEWHYVVASKPTIQILSPASGARLDSADTRIRAQIVDSQTPITANGVLLLVDGDVVDLTGAVTQVDANTLALDWAPASPFAESAHYFTLQASNQLGVISQADAEFWIEPAPIYVAEFVAPEEGAHVRDARAKIVVRAGSNRSAVTSALINGEQADWEGDANGQVVRYRFVPLVPGENLISVVIGFENGEIRNLTRRVHFDAPPTITIDTPLDLSTIGPLPGEIAGSAANLTGNVEHPVRVAGRTSEPVSSVVINQQQAVLAPDGRSFEFARFFLHEGNNVLTAIANAADGRVGSATVSVYVDHTAPLLTIEAPADQTVTSSQQISLRGQVVDAVGGLDRSNRPSVRLRNLSNGNEVLAEVDQNYFVARNLKLDLGVNRIEAEATDQAGNSRRQVIQVSRIAGVGETLSIISGDDQTGYAGSQLAEPLSVALIGADGMPISGQDIHFDVSRGDGALRRQADVVSASDGLNPDRRVTVQTDAQGIARAWFVLGTEIGVSANAVTVTLAEAQQEVVFMASVLPAAIAMVLPDGSTGFQYAATNSAAIEPLSVVVLDANRNRLEDVPVRFEVVEGNLTLRAELAQTVSDRIIEVRTDRLGRASVRAWVGSLPDTARVRAYSPTAGADVPAATFEIVSRESSNGPTSFTGIVQDHLGRSLAGVRVSISRTALSTTTDVEGRFEFADSVPAGKIDLFIDGRLAQAAAGTEYPGLHFETVVIPGLQNQLPHPIYLPPMNLSSAKVVGGAEDVVLSIPGHDGFELTVKANSVTFPDGSRVGPVVLTPVHGDRLPMVPPGGSASFGAVAWTLQPSGTRFDPPIEVRIPNNGGLKSGETVSIVQWDHDLATFVPMGQGTVNEAATQIVSNPGTGISKAGWGGCTGDCPPPPPNCGAGSEDGPAPPGYQNIRAFNLRREFFGWIEFEDAVELDRISINHRTRFKDKTFRLTNGFWDSDRCDSVRIDWLFGDGGSGTGETVDHKYRQRGQTTVRETIHCFYTSKCNNQPASKDWPKDFSIKRRDTKWIEYREAMNECGWTAACWIHVNAVESLSELSEELGQLELEILTDLRDWNRESLDMMGPGAGGVPPPGKIATLAFLHAANESIFPTSILDVVPVGKATKSLKLLRMKYRLPTGKLNDLAKGAAEACGITRAIYSTSNCRIKWKEFELRGLAGMAAQKCPNGCAKVWQPVRNVNNGFDGAAVWRDANGELQLAVSESKMWSKSTVPVEVSDLTAFGFGADSSTLRRNLTQVLDDLASDPNFTRAEIDSLRRRLSEPVVPMDVFIHVLHENRLAWDSIVDRVRALTGRTPVQIHSWSAGQ